MTLGVLLDSKQAAYIEEKIKDLVHTYDELNSSELHQEVRRLHHLVEVSNTLIGKHA